MLKGKENTGHIRKLPYIHLNCRESSIISVLQGGFLRPGRALGKQLSVKLWLEPEWQTQPAGQIPSSELLLKFVYIVARWSVEGFGLVIGFIGHFNIQIVTTYKWLSHRDECYQSRSSQLCLVMSSNSGRFSAPGLTSLQDGGHLSPPSYSSNCRLKTFSQWQLVSLCSFRTNRTENTASNSYLYSCVLHSPYLATAVSLAPQFLLWANMPYCYFQHKSTFVFNFPVNVYLFSGDFCSCKHHSAN
jgi:hypothetical protein